MKQKIENAIEKIGSTVLGKEPEDSREKVVKEDDGKNLNNRMEDLVLEMEKNTHVISKVYSIKSAFVRGLFQGLGIIIGSTILAGALYSMSVNLFGEDVLKGYILENIIEKARTEQ